MFAELAIGILLTRAMHSINTICHLKLGYILPHCSSCGVLHSPVFCDSDMRLMPQLYARVLEAKCVVRLDGPSPSQQHLLIFLAPLSVGLHPHYDGQMGLLVFFDLKHL